MPQWPECPRYRGEDTSAWDFKHGQMGVAPNARTRTGDPFITRTAARGGRRLERLPKDWRPSGSARLNPRGPPGIVSASRRRQGPGGDVPSLVVVRSTVAVVPGAVVVSTVVSVVVVSCARPPLTMTQAARKPAANRAARAENFTALGTGTYCQAAERSFAPSHSARSPVDAFF